MLYVVQSPTNSLAFEGVLDSQYFLATSLVATVSNPAASAVLALKDVLRVPRQLLTGRGPDYQLKSKPEIAQELAELEAAVQNAADSVEREAKAILLQEFCARRASAREMLQNIVLTVQAHGGASFFGIHTIGDAELVASARIYPEALLEEGVPAGDLVFAATAAASLNNIRVNGNLHDVGAALSIRITRGDVIDAIPEFTIPAAAWPAMPRLELGFPAVPFPSLSFSGLIFPSLDRLFSFAIPKQQAPPITIDWIGGPPDIVCSVTDGSLTIATQEPPKDGDILWDKATRLAGITGFSFTLTATDLRITGEVASDTAASPLTRTINVNDEHVPVILRGTAELTAGITGTYNLETRTGSLGLTSTFKISRLEIEARSDPNIFLAIKLSYVTTFDAMAGKALGRLTELAVIEPYPMELIAAGLHEAISGVLRLVALIKALDAPSPDLPDMPDPSPLLKRLAEFAAAIATWAAEAAGQAASALAALAEAVAEIIASIFDLLKKAGSTLISHIAIEVRLDAETFALRQIWISPLGQDDGSEAGIETVVALGITLRIPRQWKPALVLDVNQTPLIALIVQPSAQAADLSTDLWFDRPGAPVEAVRDSKKDGPPSEPLITLTAELTQPAAIALVAIQDGKATFFRKLDEPPAVDVLDEIGVGVTNPALNKYKLTLLKEPPRFAVFKIGGAGDDLTISVTLANDAKDRILPFLSAPKPDDAEQTSGGGVLDSLSQYIGIADQPFAPVVSTNSVTLPIPIIVSVGGFESATTLILTLDLKSLHTSLKAANKVDITVPEVELDKPRTLLGLDARFTYAKATPLPDNKYRLFVLDFSGGDVRLSLAEGIDLELWYRRIASEGRGLVFKIEDFAVGRHGIDLEASADPDVPVTLAGVEVPFRFDEGGVSIKAGRLTSFAIKGSGQLPPALIGEANVKIAIAMGLKDGRLTVQSAEAILDKGNDPIVCETTRFTFTLQKIELLARDFGADGIHFWFALTGSARFTPGGAEFDSGLLQNLNDLEIVFDKAPLTTNAALLKNFLEFHIGVRMKRAVNFFNIFKFELRGFGLHPSVERFGRMPALSISGQVEFVKAGDAVSPKIDFHKLWIAPPKAGSALPQIAFDGLGVEIKLGAATLEATAITVDGALPSLDRQVIYPETISAQGFMARGRLRIKGWAPLAAAMGFLELDRPVGGRQHAFFAFAQQEELSIEIPTPIGVLYLREIGFGFGKSYTFAGLVAADYVRSPDQLVAVLDDVSKRQGELATFSAWAPELEGDRFTLAMRALFTVATASNSGTLSEAERIISNPIMFDVAAALRSDLTFLMTARGWIATNYHAFVHGEMEGEGALAKIVVARDDIRTNPPLRGYLYISAPRQQFLGRLIADGKGYIGKTPVLHPLLREAMSGVSWSATLFIQPGLFHFEMGWPYELRFEFAKKMGPAEIGIVLEGGLVFRIEDSALLYGITFRGSGYAQLGGQVGGRSFGASAVARVDMYLAAKFIAYISLRDPNETLFYGAIDFAVTVSIRMRIWLEFRVFDARIHLEIGLIFTRTLTLALELAISPKELGGRGVATVAVSGFGRTLRLGISLGINEDVLERARVKVERFLAIGLDATVPDPAKGVAAAPPASSPAHAATQAEQQTAIEEEKRQAADAIAAKIDTSEIMAPSFWAVLFKVPAPATADPEFVMTLIPRDETRVNGLSDVNGTFYPPPPPVDLDDPNQPSRPNFFVQYDYELSNMPIAITRLLGSKGLEGHVGDGGLRFDDTAVIGISEDSADKFTLPNFLYHCFIGVQAADPTQKFTGDTLYSDDVLLKQPPLAEIAETRQRLPEDEARATETLRRAARDQMIGEEESITDYVRAVEERRSGVVSAIGESAAFLATAARAGGPNGQRYEWPERRNGIDARDLGLTFVVTEAELRALFDNIDNADKPVSSKFMIATRCSKHGQPQDPTPVHLLNPPARFFSEAHPRLAGLADKRGKTGIMLDWDLEPPWEASRGPYHDPEFLLRHYRIERLVLDGNSIDPKFKAYSVTTKAAAPFLLSPKGEIQPLRQAAQLVDDLADIAAIDPKLADVLLHRGPDAYANWTTYQDHKLLYTIVPVDIAGSEGLPTPIVFTPEQPAQDVRPLLKAEIIFHYERLADPVGGTHEPPLLRLFLRIDDPLAHSTDSTSGAQQRLPGDNTIYRLRLRREIAVSGGIYGVDALTKARERPTAQDFAQDAGLRDLDIFVVLKDRDTVLPNLNDGLGLRYTDADRFQPLEIVDPDPHPPSHPIRGKARFELIADDHEPIATLARIREHIGVNDPAGVCAVRVATARRIFVSPIDLKALDTPSGWLPADMALVVLDPDAAEKRPPVAVETVVETFEHPRRVSFDALSLEDLDGRADRLAVVQPDPHKHLADLIAVVAPARPARAARPAGPLLRLVDRQRRTATRIAWNARPSAAVTGRPGFADPKAYDKLIGGFDLFETDLAELPNITDLPDYARRIARVQRLPETLRGLDPAEITDFEKVEAFYPSETARVLAQKAASGGEGRAPWFSPAETILAWAEIGPRVSLGLAPVPAELMAVCDKGQPMAIEFTFKKGGPLSLDGAEGSAKVEFRFDEAHFMKDIDMPGVPGPRPCIATIRRKDKEPFTPGALTQLLRSLWWSADAASATFIRELFESKPEVFQTVTLLISGYSGARVTGDAAIDVNLDLPLHPFLADVVDYLRWKIPDDEKKNPAYRRYEPVLDGPPPTKAETFSDFANEFPPERDPYGWAFLRTIGLATGVKLFDMETAEYVASQDTLTLVNAAFAAIAPRYATAGANVRPFVEIISRPGGLYQLASFDSAIREEVTAGETRNLLTHEGLSLVQISLRPSPERFLDKTLVGYCLVKSKKSGDITIEPLQSLGGITGGVLYEVLDVAGGLGSSRVVRVARSEDTVARTLLAPGQAIETKVTIAAPGVDSTIALIRIAVAGTVRFDQAVTNLAMDDLDVSPVSEPSAITPSIEPEPFGRFGWLDPEVLDVLHLGWAQDGLDVKPQPDATLNIKRLLTLIARRFSKVERAALYETAERETRIELLAKLQRFTVRFIDHCAGVRGRPASIPFALATVTRPDPWRVAPTEDGRMDILIVHEDAWARRRRYVVRPFGRYENIADATPGDHTSADKPALIELKANDPEFEQRSLDVVLPRTHPVRPPVILSARRLDIWLDMPPGGDPKQRREGRQLEFVLSRHAEEIISESNRQVSDGYQFSHMGLEFYREFSSPRWARGFAAAHDWPQIDDHELVTPLGDEAGRRPAPPELSFSDGRLTEPGMSDDLQLPRRIADGWSGISAVRTGDVPYFYRLHALAHAAAGVVVSEPSAAMIPEGRPMPRFPWVLPAGWHSPWTVPEASWTIWVDEMAGEAEVRVALPLMRHFDGLSPEDYDLWLKDTVFDAKRVLRLPDAAVSYALALETDATGGSRSVIAELFPQLTGKTSAYTVIAGLTQFDVTNTVAASFVAGHWQVMIPFKKKVETVTTVTTPVLALGDEGRALLDKMEIRISGWPTWFADAPTRQATITITRPAGTLNPGGVSTIDWTPFITEINRVITVYEVYSGADAVLRELRSHAAEPDTGQNQDHKWHTKLGHGVAVSIEINVETWPAGLPRDNNGLLGTPTPGAENAFIVDPVTSTSDWLLPEPTERNATARADFSDVLRLQTVPVPAATKAAINAKVFSVIRASMFTDVSSAALEDETRLFAGFPPLTRMAVNDLQSITKLDPVDVAAPFELSLRAEFASGGNWDDDKRMALRSLILALEGCKLPGRLRALSTLEAIDAGEATIGMGIVSPFTLVMPHTVREVVTFELADLATALGVALTWEVTALTMRRPPDDGEIAALIDKLPPADQKIGGAAILAMAQEQALGPHRKLVLNLYRGFALPLRHDLGRRLA